MRDQAWLDNLLSQVWNQYFYDIAPTNEIQLCFGRKARTRLGSIGVDRQQPQVSLIRLNGLFQDPAIPAFVVQATLVHELCHYAHGFNSGGAQLRSFPHRGGVMRQEFAERGLEHLYLQQKQWLKSNWPRIVAEYLPASQRKRQFSRRRIWKFI